MCVLGALELSDTSNAPLARERGGRKDFKERGATDERRGLGLRRRGGYGGERERGEARHQRWERRGVFNSTGPQKNS